MASLRSPSEIPYTVPEAEILLVVPPFAHLSWPSLGIHLLQGLARREGLEVRVVYANLIYAAMVGHLRYASLCNTPTEWLLGERLFRRAAFGLGDLGETAFLDPSSEEGELPDRYLDQLSDATGEIWVGTSGSRFSRPELLACSQAAVDLVNHLADAIVDRNPRYVGSTTMFEQTNSSLALLKAVKERGPGIVTLLGGANCEGGMAQGLRAVAPFVDHIFSGESEDSWVQFLRQEIDDGIILGSPCRDLDALPMLDYDDYFGTIDQILPELRTSPIWLSYETSRGCWWGAKQHCTFCGLNGTGMGFREKSPDRVIEELQQLLGRYPTTKVALTDNIMPHRYHKTLIPRLPSEVPGVHLFYEQKANLSLRQVGALMQAGNAVIQPGIESLSSPVLRLMRKGVLARQNLGLLRYARSVGMGVKWNLLYGFPGDDAVDYEEMERFLPFLTHLSPPMALTHLSIDRFSPYFDHPDEHGLTEIYPLPAYSEVLPAGAPINEIAYHYQGTWESGSLGAPELMGRLFHQIVQWRRAWAVTEGSQPPMLFVREVGPDRYILYDTRPVARSPTYFLNHLQVHAVLVGGPRDRVALSEWAIHNHFALALDGWCVPLATSTFALLDRLEQERPEIADAARGLQLVHL